MGSPVVGQEPAEPDTARRPQALPAIETRVPREERAAFEERLDVATVRMTPRELTSAPRFFGEADVLRAVRMLPGVNARNDYSVGMNVRGGEADQNLVLLDGYPVYNPFHMGGLFGAFVEPMVDRVEFMTGAFPAAYGGRLSSVLDVRSAVEVRPEVHGRVDLSLIATTVSLGSGMQGGQGTWTVAARRTYIDKFLDLYRKDALPYHFRDAQAHVVRVLPGAVRVSATAYDNTDDFAFENPEGSAVLGWGNRVVGTTLTRGWRGGLGRLLPGDSLRVEQRFSRSRFNLGMDMLEGFVTLRNSVVDDRAGGTVTAYGSRRVRAVGYEVGRQAYRFDASFPLVLWPADTLVSRNVTWGLFVDELWRPDHRLLVRVGARADAVVGLGAPMLQPRVSVKYFLNPDLALTGAYGEFTQSAHTLAREDMPIRALDFWTGSGSSAPISRARHAIVGVERWLTGSRAVRVEAFYKRYPRLVEQNRLSDPTVEGDEFLRLRGHSYGADFMLRQMEGGAFSGWMAYSYNISSRVDPNGMRFFPGQDRRHELNAVGSWRRGRYHTSARFNLATGTPYTMIRGRFELQGYDPVTHEFDNWGHEHLIAGPRNGERLPLSQRLDVSVTRVGRVGGAAVSPFLSIMNVYNAKNVFAYGFDYLDDPPRRYTLPQLPVFPTLGVSVVW